MATQKKCKWCEDAINEATAVKVLRPRTGPPSFSWFCDETCKTLDESQREKKKQAKTLRFKDVSNRGGDTFDGTPWGDNATRILEGD